MAEWAAGISIIGIAIAVIVVMILAGKIARRNAQMRLVLDNVEEALVTVHRDGTLDPECSAAFVRWFGEPGGGPLRGADRPERRADVRDARARVGRDRRGRDADRAAGRPVPEPARSSTGRHYRLDIKPLIERDALVGALLRIRDFTDEVETQRTLAAQREYVAVFERALGDPHGVTRVHRGHRQAGRVGCLRRAAIPSSASARRTRSRATPRSTA